MTIESITLENTLPRVFREEQIPPSDIWKKRVVFERGRNYLVEAASGTGKSSLCAYIYGARTDYDGRILFNQHRDIGTIEPEEWQEIRRENIAYLPQELALFPELTAMQNIMLKNCLTDVASEAEIRRWLDELGIGHRADYPVGRMSIGQQQRVGIIRAICQPFTFILLDEPVSHLDAENNEIAATIIERMARRYDAAVVATSVGNQLAIPDPVLIRL